MRVSPVSPTYQQLRELCVTDARLVAVRDHLG